MILHSDELTRNETMTIGENWTEEGNLENIYRNSEKETGGKREIEKFKK